MLKDNDPRLVWSVFLTAPLVACTPLSTRDLAGRYVGRYDRGSEILALNPDGSFEQILEFSGTRKSLSKGRWTFDQKSGQLRLNNYIGVSDGYCHLKLETEPSSAAFDPERQYLFGGPIRLGPDEGCPLRSE